MEERRRIGFTRGSDRPIPELGDRVPRELATNSKGQKRLVRWIMSLEANHLAAADPIGIGDYNLDWIWKELGVERLKQGRLPM